MRLAEAKSAGMAEQLEEQIAMFRQDAKAFHEAAAKSRERELEVKLLLKSTEAKSGTPT
ncbi:hypothetical protein V2K64_07900 [Pseudomonas alliivorans]|uniref:hypothetical protein n=1 Tax=Pseudomonas syringae group TaxID=136849 RepID=UPI000208E33A|nr:MULTISPECIES: hypothetical protein [Pseudomonas syringae group]KPB71325.1 Uncharacterized protein AC507_4008 [Pseudomonas syringae pv. maculicola]MEE4888674.1 hypothetical protein [Pseudomonas alliivorans]QQN24464.1 hypothetical protein JGS08_13195 [Pseudomonas cannabina pv. alisalensis]UBY97957.1 hypothetical protein LCG56_02005 [Pseudomonas cannabina pv. alisalensis]